MEREAAKSAIGDVLEEMAAFLSQDTPPELSEADTKAYFVEPLVKALGWTGIGVVQREFYVRSTQEFIDYVMYVSGKRELAVEAKRLQVQLNEKHAAQLVQYCSVEGIEWAVLTNGRDWQVFNTYLPSDIAAKRLFRLDFLGANNRQDYQARFDQLWLLSRETFPSAIRAWLEGQRLESALRGILASPSSRTIRAAVAELAAARVSVRSDVVVRWFQGRLATSANVGPPPVTSKTYNAVRNRANGDVVTDAPTGVPENRGPVESEGSIPLVNEEGRVVVTKRHYGVRLEELLRANIVHPGTALVLMARGQDIAMAELNATGEIVYQGRGYRTPSHPDFARLQGRQASNGWASWYAVLPEGRRSLADLREHLLRMSNDK